MRAGVGRAVQVAAHGLDAGGDEHVALAGLDGVGGHADRLQRRRAVAVDGDAGDVGQAGEERRHAGDVVAGLAAGLAAAQDDVLDRLRVERGHLVEHGLDDEGRQVVGPALGEAALVGPPDGRAGGGDDDGFGHGAPPRARRIWCGGQSGQSATAGCHTRLPNVTAMSLFDDPNVGTIPEPTFSVTELSDADRQRAAGLASATRCGCGARSATSSRPQSGHVYFTLDRPRRRRLARRDAVAPPRRARSTPRSPRPAARVRMTDGTDVRIRGRLDWYSPRGAAPAADDGDRPRLHARPARARPGRAARAGSTRRGCCGPTPRTPLPLAPLRVGLVTSEGSAAEADFLDELRRSGFAFRGAPGRLAGAGRRRAPVDRHRRIRMLATHRLDVLALVRGGGARTDLAAFDDEAVARAIAACPVPVLTGVGHEIDTSVADEVAHTVGQDAHRLRPAARRAGRRRWPARSRALGRHRRSAGVRTRARATTSASSRHARHLRRAAPGWRSTAARRRLDVGRRPVPPGRRSPGSTRPTDRLDGHRGRITGAARSHLRAAEVLVAAGERRVAHRAPRALAEAERGARRARGPAARPRPGAHAGPGLVDHPRPRRLGASARPPTCAAGDAAHHPRRRRRASRSTVSPRCLTS